MIKKTFLKKIVNNLYLLRCNYGNVAKSFNCGRKDADKLKISHSLFLDYVQSIKKEKTRDILEKSMRHENNNIENLEYCKELWQKDLDKQKIKLLLERIEPTKLMRSIHDIDRKCRSIIGQLTTDEILEFLVLFLKLNPSAYTQMDFYLQSINILRTALKRNQLKYEDALKLLFFTCAKKQFRVSDVKYVMKYILPISELSLIEKSIFTNIIFRCSIKLSKLQGRIIEETIEKNSASLFNNPYLLVPLCKSVRYVGPSKKFSMKNLSEALINVQYKFDLTFIAHMISLYAEARLKNTDVLSRLYNDAFDYIVAEYENVRLKDIDRLLWSGRVLNYPPANNKIEIINRLIEQRLYENKIENNLIMNILLSLWMFNHKPTKIIKQCFENEIFVTILENMALWKPVARLSLLLSCIEIEAPEVRIPDKLYISKKVHLNIGKNIKIMFKSLEALKDDLQLTELKIDCPIKGIYISGISAKHNKKMNVHIDLLDESAYLRESNELHGLMNLKLRLLVQTGYQSILVPEGETKHPELLKKYLKKSLSKNHDSMLIQC